MAIGTEEKIADDVHTIVKAFSDPAQSGKPSEVSFKAVESLITTLLIDFHRLCNRK